MQSASDRILKTLLGHCGHADVDLVYTEGMFTDPPPDGICADVWAWMREAFWAAELGSSIQRPSYAHLVSTLGEPGDFAQKVLRDEDRLEEELFDACKKHLTYAAGRKAAELWVDSLDLRPISNLSPHCNPVSVANVVAQHTDALVTSFQEHLPKAFSHKLLTTHTLPNNM